MEQNLLTQKSTMKTHHIKTLLTAAALFGFGFASSAPAATTWNAGEDLYANEITTNETSNPNFTVPEWSYGYRGDLESTNLTLFLAGQHTNAVATITDMEGFQTASSVIVGVNVSATAITPFFVTLPIPSHEMWLHPGASGEFSVVRFTVPDSGTYLVDALWQDIDWTAGNGANAYIVRNGTKIFEQFFQNNSNPVTANFTNLALDADDTLDFVLGSNGDYNYDSTRFNATIQAVPEPSSTALLIGGTTTIFAALRRRRK